MQPSKKRTLRWSPAHGDWLRKALESAGLTVLDLTARVDDLDRATVYRWLTGKHAPRKRKHKASLARELQVDSFDALYRQMTLDIGLSWQRALDFSTTDKTLHAVDAKLLKLFQPPLEQHVEGIQAWYDGGMQESFRLMGLNCRELMGLLQETEVREELRSSAPEAGIIVEVAPRLESIEFILPDTPETLAVPDPKLLWPCVCGTVAAAQRTKLCPIHTARLGTRVEQAFFGQHVAIRYPDLGIEVRWRDCDALWPPSVDSFHMIEDLRAAGLLDQPINSLLDIGSGTSFLGIAIAANNRHVVRLDTTDWLLVPQLYGALNWELNRRNRQTQFIPHVGLFFNWQSERGNAKWLWDASVVNPPYLPMTEKFPELASNSAVAGTSLLTWTIAHCRKFSKKVYVQYSNLAQKEVDQAAEQAGVRLDPIGGPYRIPFRVRHAFKVKGYIEALVSERGLERDPESRYPLWHYVATYSVEPK